MKDGDVTVKGEVGDAVALLSFEAAANQLAVGSMSSPPPVPYPVLRWLAPEGTLQTAEQTVHLVRSRRSLLLPPVYFPSSGSRRSQHGCRPA